MGRNHGQEQQAPLTKYEKNDMISRVMPYFRGIALFFWQGPTVMVFHEYERSLFVIMDDGYPPVSILILIGFILLEAVFYGFGSAIQNGHYPSDGYDYRSGNPSCHDWYGGAQVPSGKGAGLGRAGPVDGDVGYAVVQESVLVAVGRDSGPGHHICPGDGYQLRHHHT